MKPEKKIKQAQNLLSQALSTAMASMPNNRSVMEARGHIKQAMNKLDKAQKTQTRKRTLNSSQFKEWWGNVQGGTAMAAESPMSGEARNRALGQLDSMIAKEEDKLAELDKQSQQPPSDSPSQILND
jgi:predicted Zn-dependent protease